MGIMREYVVQQEFHAINNKLFSKETGRIETGVLKLTSATGLHDEYGALRVAVSPRLRKVQDKLLCGEKTKWTLESVWMQPQSISIVYTHPSAKNDDYDFLRIDALESTKLAFEFARSDSETTEEFHIDCTSREPSNNRGSTPSGPPKYCPRVVEVLNGGALRRSTTFLETVGDMDYFTIREEQY